MGRPRKSGVVLSSQAPVMNVDSIQERVAFIKINRLCHRCADAQGVPERDKVKEVTRGVWCISNVEKRAQIQYLFAYYRQHILGVFHVVDVSSSLADAYRAGLPDFPSFPVDVRETDRWKARFASVAQAPRGLTAVEFSRFMQSLVKPNKNPDDVLRQFRKRVYFSVDDNVPAHLAAYEGSIVDRSKSFGERLCSDRLSPVILNF